MDTRESGPWLAAEVAAGLARHQVKVEFAGVTTTPGVAYLAKNGPFAAGVMISASHNPYQDNGIKLIGHAGYKLPDEQEELLEKEIFSLLDQGAYSPPAPLAVNTGLDRAYVDHLAATLPGGLDGLKIVADCANGSASVLAPELFERARRAGASHPLLARWPQHQPELRLAASGSFAGGHARAKSRRRRCVRWRCRSRFVRRAIRKDHRWRCGAVPHGPVFERARAAYRRTGHPPLVVATVMSNLGLERALCAHGIGMIRTPVGDKYVLEEMLRRGAVLGGEQSGHIIFHRYATTGDGMLTALRVFEVMREAGAGLDELTQEIQVYPQRLVNVRIKERKRLEDLPGVAAEIRAAEESFGDSGRVLVRFSGTEPLARVMVEGPELDRVEAFANRIASQIQAELGG